MLLLQVVVVVIVGATAAANNQKEGKEIEKNGARKFMFYYFPIKGLMISADAPNYFNQCALRLIFCTYIHEATFFPHLFTCHMIEFSFETAYVCSNMYQLSSNAIRDTHQHANLGACIQQILADRKEKGYHIVIRWGPFTDQYIRTN